MQTILGSGGAIGVYLAKELKNYTDEIRLVSRIPKKINETDRLMSADLLNPAKVREAVRGSSVVYVTVGFPYSARIWQEAWPKFVSAVISACEEFQAKLVFFDNIYMYDPEFLNGMTEETPVNPSSKKGKTRALVAKMIQDEMEAGKLTALIARSADFYGPGIKNSSMLNETVVKPLSTGGAANWLGSPARLHSYTYTPDAAKAVAILGNTDEAYGQVWHLPTAANPLTGEELIRLVAENLGVQPKFRAVPKLIVRMMGLFVPIMKELVEMMYQNDRDYVFDSSKFERRFNFTPTPYAEGIKQVIQNDYPR